MFNIICFLFLKLISQFLFMYTHTFRMCFTYHCFLIFYLLSFSFFLGLDFQGKFLISEIFVLYFFHKFSNCFVKRDTLFLSFFFVFNFDYSFYSSIWSFFRIVQVCVVHWLFGNEEFPLVVKFKNLLLRCISITESRSIKMSSSDFFFELFFVV